LINSLVYINDNINHSSSVSAQGTVPLSFTDPEF